MVPARCSVPQRGGIRLSDSISLREGLWDRYYTGTVDALRCAVELTTSWPNEIETWRQTATRVPHVRASLPTSTRNAISAHCDYLASCLQRGFVDGASHCSIDSGEPAFAGADVTLQLQCFPSAVAETS